MTKYSELSHIGFSNNKIQMNHCLWLMQLDSAKVCTGLNPH